MEAFGLVCFYGITTFDDLRTRQVRVIEIVFFAIVGVIYNFLYRPNSIYSLLGGVGVGAAMLLFSILSKEKIGKGDAYIIMVTGVYLGFINTLVLLWISSIFAAVIGIFIIRRNNLKGYEKELPFIPFLLLGYLVLFGANTIGGLI